MDALSFISLQSGNAAPAGIAADTPWPDGAAAGIDFAALLALGLSMGAQEQPAARVEPEMQAERAPIAELDRHPAATEPTAALLQPPLVEAFARVDAAPVANAAPAAGPLMTSASPAAASAGAGKPAATGNGVATDLAAGTANIAAPADEPSPPAAPAAPARGPEKLPDPTADPVAKTASETHPAASAEAASNTTPAPLGAGLTIHPSEARTGVSQPSALLAVQAPVSEPGFADALSRQVVWMIDKDAQIAELRIDPPELGPVEVRLTLTQDTAVAEFVSPHAEVRAALENAIARLREAMAEAGIQLGEASVSAESFGDRREPREERDGYLQASAGTDAARLPAGRTPVAARGLIDVFA